MTADQLKERFKGQFLDAINKEDGDAQQCAFASGALLVLSAIVSKDGTPRLPMQIRIMHAALREIGEEKGWGVAKGI